MLLLPFLLSCWIIPGMAAEDSPVRYYALTNSTVCLQTRKPPPYKWFEWTFDKKMIVSSGISNPDYENKTVFSPTNLSLCIKELRDSDAGNYKVSVTDGNYRKTEEIHHVIIQGTVPQPVMTVQASNLSTGSCRITVNCSLQDEWSTSHCDADRCQTSRTSGSVGKFNISIFTERKAVVCRGNNHVSSKSASENMDVCFRRFHPEHKEESERNLRVVVAAAVVCPILCVCVVVLVQQLHHHCRKSTAQLIQSQPVETPSQEEPRVSTSSTCHAEPCYENVDQPEHTSSPRPWGGSVESPTADTVYCFPNATGAARTGNGGEDKAGAENMREASASQSVTVHEPSKVDTVYCLLQRPGNLQ